MFFHIGENRSEKGIHRRMTIIGRRVVNLGGYHFTSNVLTVTKLEIFYYMIYEMSYLLSSFTSLESPEIPFLKVEQS